MSRAMRVVGAAVDPAVRAFARAALRADRDAIGPASLAAAAAVGRAEVIAQLTDAGLGPAVAQACVRADLDDDAWHDVAEAAAVQSLELDVALAAATTALTAASLRSLAMKGAALQATGIVPRGARHCDDIDLLVDDEHADAAVTALTGAGFVPLTDGFFDGTRPLRALTTLGGVVVDLHRSVPGTNATLAALWPASVDVIVEGVRVRVPTLRELLDQLCAHVVVRHHGYPRSWPKHTADVLALAPALGHTDLVGWVRAGVVAREDDAVLLSLAVTAGFLADNAPAPLRALADALVLPARPFVLLHGARFAAVRAATIARRAPRMALLPDEEWLRRSGDLVPGRSLWRARLARLRRVANVVRGVR